MRLTLKDKLWIAVFLLSVCIGLVLALMPELQLHTRKSEPCRPQEICLQWPSK